MEVGNCLVWTDIEVLLMLATMRDFGARKVYEKIDPESIKHKNRRNLGIAVRNLPEQYSREHFQHINEFLQNQIDFYQMLNSVRSAEVSLLLVESLLLFTIFFVFLTKYGGDSQSLNLLSLEQKML